MSNKRNASVRKGIDPRRAIRRINGDRASRKGLAIRRDVARLSTDEVVCRSSGRLTKRRDVIIARTRGMTAKRRKLCLTYKKSHSNAN